MCKVTLKRKEQDYGHREKVAVKEISSRSVSMQDIKSVLINVTENKLKGRGCPKC